MVVITYRLPADVTIQRGVKKEGKKKKKGRGGERCKAHNINFLVSVTEDIQVQFHIFKSRNSLLLLQKNVVILQWP
jgi:hypothetical protein